MEICNKKHILKKRESSRKEGFEFARDVHPDDTTVDPNNWFYEKSVWPDEDGTVCFKTFLKNMYETVHETSQEILRLTALGYDTHYYFQGSTSFVTISF
jgi:hypothetical protein